MDGDADATRTIEGSVLGTAAYMAPEQAQGQPLDARSDVFSFGAVLYEMFSGRRAFPGEHALSTIADVIHKEPEPLQAAPDIVRIVTRCLRKSPSERFQSAAELRAALESARVSTAQADQPSIAVLPFANMSLDKEQEFFSDGLAEEILNLLAKIPRLKVIARTSSFAFRGKEQDIRKIAEALDVKTILEGSVRRSGSRIRVTAQLIDAADGSHLWSDRYDRELTDVFDVQDEIAAAIAGTLQLKLAPKPTIAERYKPNLPAYEAYLRGEHHFLKVTPASMALGKEYFEQAISLDPKFALPYACLASYYASQAVVGLRPASEAMPQVQAWAQKALELDASLSEAHAALGLKAFEFDYDWNEAARQFSLALSCDPVPPLTRRLYTVYTVSLGRAREAEELVRHEVEADPLVVWPRLYLGWILQATGRAQEAGREYRHVLELDENFYFGWFQMGGLRFVQGETSEAIRCFEKAHSLAPFWAAVSGALAGLLARTGDMVRAEELLAQLGPPETYGVPRAWAYFHLFQGDAEKAVDWWDKAIDQRHPFALVGQALAGGAALRTSPRWPALAKRMNLPAYAW
jgi:serine/threonine-protein kinase